MVDFRRPGHKFYESINFGWGTLVNLWSFAKFADVPPAKISLYTVRICIKLSCIHKTKINTSNMYVQAQNILTFWY